MNKITCAIAIYDPDHAKYHVYKALYVEHKLEDMPSQPSSVESVPIQQANLFISIIVGLREDNKLLTERLDRQEELFQELKSQNLELKASLSRTQLEFIRQSEYQRDQFQPADKVKSFVLDT